MQLIIAKMILPWFGGSAAVWTTCMLFFQVVLLLGYYYADASIRFLRPKAQVFLHASLLAACLFLLPIVPGAGWRPAPSQDPTLRILALLSATVGLPYLLLSTTSPLLQAWYVRTYRGAMPYRLFALSNAGSMIALLSYPVLVEPFFAVRRQAEAWSAGFLAFALLCAAAALRSRKEEGGRPDAAQEAGDANPGRGERFLWMTLAACASTMLLAVTNHLTQNVAAIPFLWVLPLTLYLLSFILCFSGEGRYRRNVYLPLLAAALAGMSVLLSEGHETERLSILIPLFAGGLFVGCMVCHGELAAMKPHPRRLTSYYLMVSLGGAVGGIFVGLVAPYGFRGYYELPAGIAASAALSLAVLWRSRARDPAKRRWRNVAVAIAAVYAAGLTGLLAWQIRETTRDARVLVRNFYGGLKVSDSGPPGGDLAMRTLVHGTITHGRQFLEPGKRRLPTTYYGPKSGVGLALLDSGRGGGPLRVGVVGLGAGTIAAYGRRGDLYRFYEINPLVVRLADTEFSFLRDSEAKVEIVLGDARLSLEAESPQGYDVLVVDAFSGDSIPVHLLTREAFDLYFRHLKEDGVLAVHVSNRYLDLKPVVGRAAETAGKETLVVDTGDEEASGVYGATWVLVSGDRRRLSGTALSEAGEPLAPGSRGRLWTDDYSNLFGILK
ncbi:MAG: spermidine synthase [Deltaproteobacteria bacterium]|nr:fused MFS/spermidine synthase [Candidatus Deferrimicrobiaceae bacterium]